MKTVGIICEYNPLHLGHVRQFRLIRELLGEETVIVCLMSGNFVQRGAPAIVDKTIRAEAALLAGADLVLELPVTCALSSAEGFADGGVEILAPFCDYLCFGAETAETDALLDTARALLSDAFPPLLRARLDTGMSFPAARSAALGEMGLDASLLDTPNNILAVEYCKAILRRETNLKPLPILRGGSYHDESPDPQNPSATSVRRLMLQKNGVIPSQCSHRRGNPPDGQSSSDKPGRLPHQSADRFAMTDYLTYIPEAARPVFFDAPLHCTEAGEKAILFRLRTMTEAEFEALPYGSEGLWRKLMHASRSCATLEEIIAATKSKRYTRTRLDRMVMCAFLGITREMLEAPLPYTRVLGFNDRGRSVLKKAKQTALFLNAGEPSDHPYWQLEQRCSDLYGLCCTGIPEPPGAEERRRIIYKK